MRELIRRVLSKFISLEKLDSETMDLDKDAKIIEDELTAKRHESRGGQNIYERLLADILEYGQRVMREQTPECVRETYDCNLDAEESRMVGLVCKTSYNELLHKSGHTEYRIACDGITVECATWKELYHKFSLTVRYDDKSRTVLHLNGYFDVNGGDIETRNPVNATISFDKRTFVSDVLTNPESVLADMDKEYAEKRALELVGDITEYRDFRDLCDMYL